MSADSNLGHAAWESDGGHLTFGGGTLRVTSGIDASTSNRGIALTGAGTTFDQRRSRVDHTAASSPAPSTLTKTGTGTLVLSGDEQLRGTTAVSAGVLRVQ